MENESVSVSVHVFVCVCMCVCRRDRARELQHSLWVGGTLLMMPANQSEDELSVRP